MHRFCSTGRSSPSRRPSSEATGRPWAACSACSTTCSASSRTGIRARSCSAWASSPRPPGSNGMSPTTPAGPRVPNHLLPEALRVAYDHGVGIVQGLPGEEGGVVAAHDHGDAPPPEPRGDLVRPSRRVGLHRQRDEVSRLLEGNGLEALVEKSQFDVRGRSGGQDGEDQNNARTQKKEVCLLLQGYRRTGQPLYGPSVGWHTSCVCRRGGPSRRERRRCAYWPTSLQSSRSW